MAKHGDIQIGFPATDYTDTKANIEALAGVSIGASATATDNPSAPFGRYDGTVWHWSDNEVGISIPATTAANDFQVGNGAGAWVKNTLAQVITTLRTVLDVVYSAVVHTHTVIDILAGANVIINGDFDTDSNWTKGTGWTISGGVAVATGVGEEVLTAAVPPLIAGVSYEVTYDVVVTSGDILAVVGGVNGAIRSSSGTYTEIIEAENTTFYFYSDNTNDFTGTIDNVIVVPISLPASLIRKMNTAPADGNFYVAFSNSWTNAAGQFVSLTVPQTILGVKTFDEFPISPTAAPTTNYQLANKKYVDDKKLDDLAAPDDNTDLNATTTKHGLLVKATAPAAGLLNVLGIINGATAYSMNDFATWVRSALLTGLSTATNAVIAATDTVLVALGKLQAQINDGWIGVSWAGLTRVSATVFTTTTDVSGIIGKKTKLKLTDTTTKYLPVLSATWNGSITTITTIANNDYALVGNPSAVYYSNIENPFGWPDTFAFTVSPTNLTVVGTPTYTGKFKADGFVTITLVATTSIASTSGSTYVNSPFKILASSILASGFYNTSPGNSFAYDADDNIYLPTFAANGNLFAISGFISY